MKRFLPILLILFVLLPSFCGCDSKPEPPKGPIENVLFLGDDLMESGRIYDWFSSLCFVNGRELTVEHMALEDARMYTYADMCDTDPDFAAKVKEADVILFEEGSAETETTVESVEHILTYADDPMVVCISLYGYPKWMYENLFEKEHPELGYADADYYISQMIAMDYAPMGYEHLCNEDYIHPNEFNGYITALMCYNTVFDILPDKISHAGLEDSPALIGPAPADNEEEMAELLARIHRLITLYMTN